MFEKTREVLACPLLMAGLDGDAKRAEVDAELVGAENALARARKDRDEALEGLGKMRGERDEARAAVERERKAWAAASDEAKRQRKAAEDWRAAHIATTASMELVAKERGKLFGENEALRDEVKEASGRWGDELAAATAGLRKVTAECDVLTAELAREREERAADRKLLDALTSERAERLCTCPSRGGREHAKGDPGCVFQPGTVAWAREQTQRSKTDRDEPSALPFETRLRNLESVAHSSHEDLVARIERLERDQSATKAGIINPLERRIAALEARVDALAERVEAMSKISLRPRDDDAIHRHINALIARAANAEGRLVSLEKCPKTGGHHEWTTEPARCSICNAARYHAR